MISTRGSQRDAAIRRVVTHGGIHQKLGAEHREAVKHPLRTWNVDPESMYEPVGSDITNVR